MRAEDHSGRLSIRALMTDNLGRLGIRSAQILVVIALASVVVLALVQVKLVIIPVLIALILAAAQCVYSVDRAHAFLRSGPSAATRLWS